MVHSLDYNSTEQRLQRIHDKVLYNLLKIDENGVVNEKDIEDAKFLQDTLNYIKQKKLGLSTSKNNIANEVYLEFLDSIIKSLQHTRGGKDLFIYSGSAQEKGAQFEEDFAKLIISTFNVAKRKQMIINLKKLQGSSVQTGTIGANVLGFMELDETAKEIVRTSYKEVSDHIKKEVTHKDSKDAIYQAVSGKIDATGLAYEIELSTSIDTDIKRLITLLNQSTFSLKNYLKSSVELGSRGANFYRAFYSMAKFAGEEDIDIGYWRMNNCLKFHNSENVVGYVSRLRFMYELSGIGQDYGKKNAFLSKLTDANGVRFLIRNDSGPGGGIFVQSVTEILWKRFSKIEDIILTKDINSLLYGSVSVSIS